MTGEWFKLINDGSNDIKMKKRIRSGLFILMKMGIHFLVLSCLIVLISMPVCAQEVLETGGRIMPNEWIDKATGHRIIKLTRDDRNNLSFYFNNNPFVGDYGMVYYSSAQKSDKDSPFFNTNKRDKQIYFLNLKTFESERLTNQPYEMKGEIVYAKRMEVYYQVDDRIYCVNTQTKKERLVYVFPSDFKGDITAINADGTLLGGTKSCDEEKEMSRQYPNKSDYFNRIFEAKFPRTLFTINIKTKVLTKLFTDSAWLNHVQFSPTNPSLMLFCHEGPWHKVDRIWTIDIETRKTTLIHKRSMPMEIAGHEWFGESGKTVWFDLQQPRGATFFVGGVDLATNKEVKYEFERDGWSVHYNSSADETLFAGDGGDEKGVARAHDGKWIYLFTPDGDTMKTERLVDMSYHQYRLEPNVHFTPDGKWIIFRANFEGKENIYAVAVRK